MSFRFLFAALWTFSLASAWAQLRIVDYNTAGGPREGIAEVFAALGIETVNGIAKAPDVIALQEQNAAETTTKAIVDVLNSIYGVGTYAFASLNAATSGAGRPGLIYNTQTVLLLGESAIGTVNPSGQARQTMRYQLRPVGYDSAADFYVYSSHYKASTGSSNAARRNVEAQAIRANADSLGQGAHIIYAGDFNIYSSNEAMWTTLTGSGAGQAFDPVERVGNWHDNIAFRDVHTQSPAATSRYSGQITGGMDDRFDFQLVTGEFLDGEGLAYIAGSYRAFGNTGSHVLNGDITSGSAAALAERLPGYSTVQAAAVLEALAKASDHLPVVADYQVPARMGVNVLDAPTRVIVGGNAAVVFSVENTASVVAANGADELDYSYLGYGALAGSGSGTIHALAGATVHTVPLNTSTVGESDGTLNVTTDSQGAANREFTETFGFDILDHAQPLLLRDGVTIGSIDFGPIELGLETVITFELANAAGLRAGLDLDGFQASGDVSFFAIDLEIFERLVAGESISVSALFSADAPGSYNVTYEFAFSDEDLPGSTMLGVQSLTLMATVVPEPSIAFLLTLASGCLVAIRLWRTRRSSFASAFCAGTIRRRGC